MDSLPLPPQNIQRLDWSLSVKLCFELTAAQTDLVWRELLTGTSLAVGGKRLKGQNGHGNVGVRLPEELLLSSSPLPPHPRKEPKLTDERW